MYRRKGYRVGEIKTNINGSNMKIIEYKTRANILVEFLDSGVTTSTNYTSFINGTVTIKNPYEKTVYEVGFIGEGKYKSYANKKQTHYYKTWCGILRRCYSKNEKEKFIAYRDVTVSDEWLNFQNFCKWYDDNYYQVDGEIMHLDKDILVKGNKVYSKETCVYVPVRINSLFVKNDSRRGMLPIGVTYDEQVGKYIARCSGGIKKKTEHISTHNTPEEAFHAYKINKELVIKDTANLYRGKIPNKLYEAMINYKVEITD